MKQDNIGQEKLYSIRVIDYSLPSFVSADKKYYGTEQMILEFLKAAIQEDATKHNMEILKAAEEYFSDQGSGKISLFGEKPMPLIEAISWIGDAAYQREDIRYMFYNIHRWGIEHHIKQLKAKLIYIKDKDGKYKRCIKAELQNVSYGMGFILETYDSDSWMCWGLPGFITVNGTVLTNTLYFVDTIFKSKEAARKDMKHPHKPYLRNFFLEIFGDG